MGGGSLQVSHSYPQYGSNIRGPEIRHIYNDRLSQFTDPGEYKDVNLLSMLYHGRIDTDEYLKLEVYSPPDLSRPLFEKAVTEGFRLTKKGETFGPSWSTHWFRVTIKCLPTAWKHYERVQLEFDLPEGLIYDEHGNPLQGITGGDGGDRRVEYILSHGQRSGDFPFVIYIETSMNGMFGVGNGSTIQPPDPNRFYELRSADLVAPNMVAWRLLWDFQVIRDLSRQLEQNGRDSHRALRVANDIMNNFRHDDPSTLSSCRKIATAFLGQVDSSDIYKESQILGVTAVGHCHIDTAWLWPFAETRRKIARSWSTQCDLMDRYTEFRFTCSQAQQYKWLQEDYPKLFERVAAKIRKGSFEPIGGSWVEMDTNMPSGESLCRQLLFGQRYFESQFGKRCTVFWLPDTFGYSSQLPQLSRSAGMSSFFTQKLSWNNINDFPHSTFNWQGLDGTQVLTHMAPNNTYTAQADVADVLQSEKQHKNLSDDASSLLVFGNGDGGGGPLEAMLEKLRRCRGASGLGAPTLPKVALDSVSSFFARLEKSSSYGRTLRTWVGELYFEFHRGTYTSQAATKKYNRTAERLLHDLEYFSSLAWLYSQSESYAYPRSEINALWQDVLLCQFHDVLPGSCIGMVYADEHAIHQNVLRQGQQLLNAATQALGMKSDLEESESSLTAMSSLAWPRREIVYDVVHGDYLTVSTDGFGNSECEYLQGDAKIRDCGDGIYVLQNALVTVTVEDGHISSFLDKRTKRELVPADKLALLYEIYEDQPLGWQAWDVELFHLDKPPTILRNATSIITRCHSNRVSLSSKFQISDKSWLRSEVSLDSSHIGKTSSCKQLNVTCEIEWHENKSFLKVAFPTTLHSREATYETQYGIIKRPTHFNTTWDEAKFEVCCHKFADLSEFNYGLSIINDCKYGFATHGSTMRLSLLRSSKAPDDTADMGRHTFRLAMIAHDASFEASGIVQKAFEFNYPLQLTRISKSHNSTRHFSVKGDSNVILDTIKLAEDSDSIVIRCYETLGGHGHCAIIIPESVIGRVKGVWRTNILEDRQAKQMLTGNSLAIELKPFEIQTYLFVLH